MTPITLDPSLLAATRAVVEHPVYREVRDLQPLRTFLEHHVVCVFDFMTLLKRLQSQLTCTTWPWLPAPDGASARLINEIVLDEESDAAYANHADSGGEPASHYTWYLAAMQEIGANTAPMRALEAELRAGTAPARALRSSELPAAAQAFLRTTFEIAMGPPHVVAGAFVLSREDVIPEMFAPLVRELRDAGTPCELLLGYLERHIEVDSEAHGPAAMQLLERLVDGDETRRREALGAALRALRARAELWDAVLRACRERRDEALEVQPST